MFKIENDKYIVHVKMSGAELCSMVGKENGKEYIWQADPTYWKRHAPTLFPIVGTLNPSRGNGMGRHGFARDMDFKMIESEGHSIKLELTSTEKTLEVYPYRFRLVLSYTLVDASLKIGYQVENLGIENMPFSIGAHPAFPCDLHGGRVMLEFEKEEDLQCLTLDLEKGLLDGGQYGIALENRKLKIKPKTFDRDALVFKNLNSNWIKVIDPVNETEVKVNFEGFPYMGIWSPGAPFVCIEPWYGVTDSLSDKGPLKDKEGIIELASGSIFRAEHSIEIVK